MIRLLEGVIRVTCKQRLQVQGSCPRLACICMAADAKDVATLEQTERALEGKGRGKKK